MHPYTQALLSAIPLPDPVKERSRRRILLEGDLPSPRPPALGLQVPHAVPEVQGPCTDGERVRCVDGRAEQVRPPRRRSRRGMSLRREARSRLAQEEQ
ncbi:hypothetical protein [Nonomuraea dietziae]|uniref:hypothetical protein n=1 Tax=Nonomuraea dietziae TaxID=65515 RepID=UPI0031D3E733